MEDFFIPVKDVTEMLGMMVIMHYILKISPPAQVLAAYGVLCRLFGDTTNEIKLSKMQKELVGKFKWFVCVLVLVICLAITILLTVDLTYNFYIIFCFLSE